MRVREFQTATDAAIQEFGEAEALVEVRRQNPTAALTGFLPAGSDLTAIQDGQGDPVVLADFQRRNIEVSNWNGELVVPAVAAGIGAMIIETDFIIT